MTVLEVIQSATAYLSRHGVEQPRLNAEHLLAAALGKKRLELYLEFDRPLSDQERAPLRDTVKRRSEGTPLQYLLGEWDFYGRVFRVDPRALIPRPETEQLVELVLAQLPKDGPLRLADVGTGSGVIGITLALERPDAKITATDLSADALGLAADNAAAHGVADRIQYFQQDLLKGDSGPFEGLIANLPYIPSAEIAGLAREVQKEPTGALDGGTDGLDLIRRLIQLAPTLLTDGGWLALEFATGQEDEISRLFKEVGLAGIRVEKDYQGLARFALATKNHG